MSFSVSATDVDRYGIPSAMTAALEDQLTSLRRDNRGVLPDWYNVSEVRDAVEAGTKAAEILAKAIGEGRPDFRLHVTISGHVNSGNVPTEGYANDQVQVSVASAALTATERSRREQAEAAERDAARATEVAREERSRQLLAEFRVAGGTIAEAEWLALDDDEQDALLLAALEAATTPDAKEGEGDEVPTPDGDAGGTEAPAEDASSTQAGDGGDGHDVAPDGTEPAPAREVGSAEGSPAADGPSASDASVADDGETLTAPTAAGEVIADLTGQ